MFARRKDNDTVTDTTTNRISIRRVMATCEGTIAGSASASGTAVLDQTIMFAAVDLKIAFSSYRIRK